MKRLLNFLKTRKVEASLLLVLLLFCSLLFYLWFTFIAYNGQTRVIFEIVPNDATLKIDNKQVNSRAISLKPGTYALEVTKKGYVTFEDKLIVFENVKDTTIPVSLVPITSEAIQESEKNESKYFSNEALGGKRAQQVGNIFRDKNPIVSRLPFKNFFYTIGYRSDNARLDGTSIIITINAVEGLRANAAAEIERWGYNPPSLNIELKNYRNPFDEK